MNDEVVKGLTICYKIGNMLKEAYPEEVMAMKKNALVAFKSKSRLCSNVSLGGCMAHYHTGTPHRICFLQKFLKTGRTYTCEYASGHSTKGTHKQIDGTIGYVDLSTHELAHHRTKRHGDKWKAKYLKFKQYIINKVISGEYYK